MSWVFIMSWSVLAMEAAACYVGECRDPARDAKIAMTASGLYGFFIYVTLPLMLVVVLGSAPGRGPADRVPGVHRSDLRGRHLGEVGASASR